MYNYHNYVYGYAKEYQLTLQPMPVLAVPTMKDGFSYLIESNIRTSAGMPSVTYAESPDFTVYTSTNKAASFPALIDDGRRDDSYAFLGLSA
jgi:hypothetical protein